MNDSTSQLLYRVETAANLCDMGRSKFWELVMSGEIKSIKIGKARRIPARELQAWISRQIEAADAIPVRIGS